MGQHSATAPGSASVGNTTEAARINAKLLAGAALLARIRGRGAEVGMTPKDLVWSQDKVSLYRFRPLAESRVRVPVLITYGLVGRWTMTDLQEGRSLARNLLHLGVDLYVVDWGNPSRANQFLTLADYICGYLADCVEEIARRAGVRRVNLLGVCEGGVFAACYAALQPERVNALALAVTPIDFHADGGQGLLNLWARSLPPEDIDRLIEAHGNLPGALLGAAFNGMTPVRTLLKHNFDLLEILDDEAKLLNWLRMEAWLADRPDHPGAAAKQWLQELYQQNKLAKNELALDGRRVDLGRITMPVLNVYAEGDHIVPPATSRALGPKVGTADYAELALPGGHVGVFVGARSQALFAPAVAAFVGRHDGAAA